MSAPVFLIGGGRDPAGVAASHAPFAAAVDGPVLCVCEDDPQRWEAGLRSAGLDDLHTVGLDDPLPAPDGYGGVYVGGGLTPAYAQALAEWGAPLRTAGVPYAGFSAGAAVAATTALVGGWRLGGRVVCDEDAGEELDELTVRPGLGLVPFAVEVHATQWGTLTRLAHAVAGGLVAGGVAVDEHTCVQVRGDELRVSGWGSAYRVGPGALQVLPGG